MAARYICVVCSDVCPMPELMTAMGVLRLRAVVAQVWRLT